MNAGRCGWILSFGFLIASCSGSEGGAGAREGNRGDGGSAAQGGRGGTAVADGTGGTGVIVVDPDAGLVLGGCGADCVAPRHCGASSRKCLGEDGCAADGDCAGGHLCDLGSGKCEIGGECGQKQFEFEHVAPNVLILLDRSGSMDDDADGDTRWNVAKKAILAVTTDNDEKIRFGLATYSACLPGGCSAGSVVVPIAPNNAGSINDFLATTVDQGSKDGQGMTSEGKIRYLCDSGDPETSTGKSLDALVGEKSLLDGARTNAVILLTDGKETEECVDGCDGPCGAERLLAQSPPVKTFVIGLGVNKDAIDEIAKSGGTTEAVAANNLSELSRAFGQVATAVASCDYQLGSSPPDAEQLFVFFNDDPAGVPNDAAEGWSYEGSTRLLEFHGRACEELRSGSVKDLDVVFGCAKPVIE